MKFLIVLLGLSQTSKSTIVNTLAHKQVAQTGKFGEGNSTTKSSTLYGPYQIGQHQQDEIILIDTQGFGDTNLSEQDPTQNQKQQVLILFQKYQQQISNFNPDKLVFGITESVQGDTVQFPIIYKKLIDMVGNQFQKCTIVFQTKITSSNNIKCEFNKHILTKKLNASSQMIKSINENLPVIPFYTNYSVDNFEVPQISNQDFIQQEDLLLEKLKSQELESYPIEIFEQYQVWKEQRIQELLETENIGYKNITKKVLVNKTRQRLIEEKVSRGFFRKGKWVQYYITENYQEPQDVIERLELKSKEQLKNEFENEINYKAEQQQKFDQLYKNLVQT